MKKWEKVFGAIAALYLLQAVVGLSLGFGSGMAFMLHNEINSLTELLQALNR